MRSLRVLNAHLDETKERGMLLNEVEGPLPKSSAEQNRHTLLGCYRLALVDEFLGFEQIE